MNIVPIGVQCSSVEFKKLLGLKTVSYPFDSMFAPPKFVFDIMVLLFNNVDPAIISKDYFFNYDKRTDVNVFDHYFTSENGKSYSSTLNGTTFPHEEGEPNDIVEKYSRRLARMKNDILDLDKELLLLFTSSPSRTNGYYTLDGVDVFKDTYKYLNDIHELVKQYRSGFKMVVFDALQEGILNDSIIHVKLLSRDQWHLLYEEMKHYSWLLK